MDDVRVISSEIDGAALRRERRTNARYLRCDGKADDGEIQEAIESTGQSWSLSATAWDRIFGGKT